ncbi:MAG: iron chelate uptake ABC transporter family permease subunit [Sphaerochaeta sp.]|nr:iron chelate uptake ABC transporter family permease subunit [Sphaerochaeta sp.]
MTLGCDLVARTVFSPYELPVGIVLSFLGSPFFLFLLFKRKRSDCHA